MTNLSRLFYGLLVGILLLLNGCQLNKQEVAPTPGSQTVKVTFFKNQTGNPNAEGLQVQLVDPVKNVTLNVYGTFDALNNPVQARSLTLQKTGNDTTVHVLLNAVTNQLEIAYLDVKGTKQAAVLKASYPTADATSIQVSLYDYNWQTNTGSLKSEATYRRPNTTATPTFSAYRVAGAQAWVDGLKTVAASIALTETFLLYAGGAGYLVTPAIIAAVAPLAFTVGTFALHVTLMAVLIDTVAKLAQAAEPENTPIPQNTPPQHPSTVPAPASLPASSCSIPLAFTASMDSFGSILIAGVSGGTGPYSYSVGGRIFQTSQVFGNNYPAGSYIVAVRSGAGCVSTQLVSLTRALPCLPEDQLKLLAGSTAKTWRLLTWGNYDKAGNGSLYTIWPVTFVPAIVFKTDGSYSENWELKLCTNCLSPPRSLEQAPFPITGSFCRLSANDQLRLYGVNYRIEQLTATNLTLVFDASNGAYTKGTFVAQ